MIYDVTYRDRRGRIKRVRVRARDERDAIGIAMMARADAVDFGRVRAAKTDESLPVYYERAPGLLATSYGDRDPPSPGERERRRRQPPVRVSFRKLDEDLSYEVKEGDVIGIFVDKKDGRSLPQTRYYQERVGAQWGFLGDLLSASHPATPREYARLERHLTRDHGYRLVVL